MNEPELKKAMTTLEFLSQDREARMQYEARQKYLHDEASLLEAAENAKVYGFKTGMEQAKKEMALKLLALGIDTSAIIKATGLSSEEIQQLNNESK
ncbi:hypothetical protein CDO73_01170 [Saccharibacillus sp. O23]|uniref:Rpn family recombination-promoting nuclease/putative transposase n=1 Tax=Saccharibacillus sp. O23 TaxID=2009338 RepID=UPI000B4E3CA4|nr:Rpn family recombination-promoting nuclease/putative transposase [Saccharibacillus sp. O23]OWR33216.1 hypothetical protein CDO73_01170 [Saccharibacillus sp. O23]